MGTAASSARAGAKTKRTMAKRAGSAGAAKVATVTVGELRSNFKAVEAKLAKGLRVQVTRRGEVVAEVLPVAPVPGSDDLSENTFQSFEEKRKGWLEFLDERKVALRAIWGDKPVDLDTTALISEGRDRDCLL